MVLCIAMCFLVCTAGITTHKSWRAVHRSRSRGPMLQTLMAKITVVVVVVVVVVTLVMMVVMVVVVIVVLIG